MDDKKTTIKQLKDIADKFVKDRNWGKHHSLKNLAVSIAIEAAELMEHFQWDELRWEKNKKAVEEELADVLIYCLYFAIEEKIDISKAIEAKLAKAAKKYPVKIFNGKGKHSEDYWKIKKDYRKKAQ